MSELGPGQSFLSTHTGGLLFTILSLQPKIPLLPACPSLWQHCEGRDALCHGSPQQHPVLLPPLLLLHCSHSSVTAQWVSGKLGRLPTPLLHWALTTGCYRDLRVPALRQGSPTCTPLSGHCPGAALRVSQGSFSHRVPQRPQGAVTSPHGKCTHVSPSPRHPSGGDFLPTVGDALLLPAPLTARRAAPTAQL